MIRWWEWALMPVGLKWELPMRVRIYFLLSYKLS